MKLCIIANGKFRHTRPYIEYFRAAGHEVHYISLNYEESEEALDYCIDDRAYASLGKLGLVLSAWRTRKLVSEIAPDCIMAQFATSGGLASWIAAQGVPYMICAHGSDILRQGKSRFWKPILKRVLRDSFLVNSVSEEVHQGVLQLGVDPQKSVVAPLGIDLCKFSIVKQSGSEVVRLLCTRSFEAVYDNETIIKALAGLKREVGLNFQMTFAGGGTLLESCKALVQELDLENEVQFLGAVSGERIAESLAKADIYLSASLSDGTSLSLMEAFAARTYPVVSDIQANTVLMQSPDNGAFFKVGDVKDLVKCLESVLQEKRYLNEDVLDENYQLVCEKFDRQSTMKVVEDAILKRIQ